MAIKLDKVTKLLLITLCSVITSADHKEHIQWIHDIGDSILQVPPEPSTESFRFAFDLNISTSSISDQCVPSQPQDNISLSMTDYENFSIQHCNNVTCVHTEEPLPDECNLPLSPWGPPKQCEIITWNLRHYRQNVKFSSAAEELFNVSQASKMQKSCGIKIDNAKIDFGPLNKNLTDLKDCEFELACPTYSISLKDKQDAYTLRMETGPYFPGNIKDK